MSGTSFRTIRDLGDLRGKRALVRADLNIPMDGSRIVDDARIGFAIPAILELCRAGARVFVVAHLGKGKLPENSLEPVARRLRVMLGEVPLTFCRSRIQSESFRRRAARVKAGEVMLLENIRSYEGETENSATFAAQLASIADVYVNEAFGVCHRAHASLVGVTNLLPSAAGPRLISEVAVLSRLLDDPKSPFVALIGGAKLSTKVPVILRMLAHADSVLIGGAIVHSFLAARGYGVGNSLVSESSIADAKRVLQNRQYRNLTLPLDFVVGDPSGEQENARVVQIGPSATVLVEPPDAILDIGPRTIRAYAQTLRSASMIVWNGPMGWFEQDPYQHGSMAMARVIASRSSSHAFGVVGGGETLAVLARTKMANYIDHVSAGGGAMLAFLAGEPMTAIEQLYHHAPQVH
jgi:3-phosphoglycerate kinase